MSEHTATIDWSLGEAEFTYKTYPRDHTWRFEGGVTVAASAAPAYMGSADRVDPEEAFVASLSSCHMLTFLALCAKHSLPVASYRDKAVGQLEKTDGGKLAITRVTLHPEIVFSGDAPDAETLAKLHHEAHELCFIANSVTTDVRVA